MDKSFVEPIFVTDTVIDAHAITAAVSISYNFPLYLYANKSNRDLFSSMEPKRTTNFSEVFYQKLASHFIHFPAPEKVFCYIYSIIHCRLYQLTYADYLKYDFPHIPFTDNFEIFNAVSSLGKRLIDLHLLESSELNNPVAKYQGTGDDHVITLPKYSEIDQRLYINSSHYFEGLKPEVWNYQIGGYQVLDKYLKERKGRRMDDPRYFIRVATALAKTIEIQEEIDAIYPEVEKNVISFKLSD